MKNFVISLTAVLFFSAAAHGSINLDRTRLVFNEADKSISLRIENQSKTLPYLAYSWIEDEHDTKSDTFFISLPPVQRLEPGSISQVRIMKQEGTAGLPADRETLYYFNLREIPPLPEFSGKNNSVMQLAMQSKIKMFYRPKALQNQNIRDEVLKMKVQRTDGNLNVSNPTPFHITVAYIGKMGHGGMLSGFKKGTMIAPFGILSVNTDKATDFKLGYMDDYGSLQMLDITCPTLECSISEHKDKKK